MWRIDGSADYGSLDRAARGKIDIDRIARHWENMRRCRSTPARCPRTR
ncbi:Tn3 family transposase [Rhodococcus jostii]